MSNKAALPVAVNIKWLLAGLLLTALLLRSWAIKSWQQLDFTQAAKAVRQQDV